MLTTGDHTMPLVVPMAAEPVSDSRGPMIAPALARAIIAVVFCGFGLIALAIAVSVVRPAGEIALAVGCLLALLGLQYFYFCHPSTDLSSPRARAALLAQAGLVYLPFTVVGQAWVSQPSFLAGSVLLVLRPRWAWVAYAAVVASTGFEQYLVTGSLWDISYILTNTATTGIYVYGLTRLARLVTELHAARDDLATIAVTHERVRFARDLHVLLGASLSAIAPRGELTLRLLRRHSEQAGQELLEILAITRRALADLRSIARLYRESALDDETASLIAMLAASEVDLRVDLDIRELSPDVRRRLAAVLRDGVATVLRQREPTRCEIVVRQTGGSVTVDLHSDGLGTGVRIAELAATVAAAAGELTTPTGGDGRPHLRATLPMTARAARRGSVEEPAESVPLVATKVANGIVVAVLCGLYLQAQLRLVEVNHDPAMLALGTATLVGALALQVGWFSRPQVPRPSPFTYLMLGLLAVLVYLPWLHNDQMWTGL